MTRDEAEEIWMANQVGMFTGTQGELAEAVLILTCALAATDAAGEKQP